VLDSFDLFPLLNLIFSVNENQNLRFSFSRTIARPSFKELSFAQILDPVSNRIFNGGLFPFGEDWDGNLIETRINNVDLRWNCSWKGDSYYLLVLFTKHLKVHRIGQTSSKYYQQ
jgi:outer membrane receptor protein involved in Fe transport